MTQSKATDASTALQVQKKKVKLRRRVKAKKPDFQRQESWRYKRVKRRWRRPRGLDSKMRLKVKGWPKAVNISYRGPKEARFLHPSGYKEILVYNVSQIEGSDPGSQAIRIAHTVGAKKRLEIISRARERGLRVLNPHEVKRMKEEEVEKVEALEEKEEISEAEGEEVMDEENSNDASR